MAGLDRYELVERIAVGGMAEVYRAKAYGPHGFEKTLAVKRILPGLARDPELVARFIAEAKVAVGLGHANIVHVYDFGRLDDGLYIAMEHVDGLDLAGLLADLRERGEPAPLPAALHIGLELLKGLDFAHRRGVVHRDVSPSNVLLSRAGEVKISDFGIAKTLDSGYQLSGARRVMGKWRYMSPEQTRGDELDARSDVFSAGVVLHELLTGATLFPGDDIETIVRGVSDGPIPLLGDARPDAPAGLDAVLGRALARDRDQRATHAGELQRALLEACYESRLVAGPDDVGRLVSRIAGAPDRGGEPISIDRAVQAQLDPDRKSVRRTVRDGPGERHKPRTLVVRRVPGRELTILEEDTRTPTSITKPPPRAGRRSLQVLVGGAAVVGVLGAILVVLRQPNRAAVKPPASPDAAVTPVAFEEPAPPPPAVPDAAPAPAVRYGRIDLHTEPWAEVYLQGRKVGEAPVEGLRLPVGRHKLKLKNPVVGRERTIEVEVPGKGPYRVTL